MSFLTSYLLSPTGKNVENCFSKCTHKSNDFSHLLITTLQLLSLLTCLQVIEFCQDCVYIVEKNFENISNLHTLVVKHDQCAHVGHQVLPTCTRWLSSITNVHKLVKFLSNLTVNFTYKVKFRSKIFCQLRSTCTRWSRSTCVSSNFINYFFGKNTRY